MFENIGFGELLLIVLAILLLFGAKRIPEIARNIGKGMNEFKKGLKDVQDNVNLSDDAQKDKDKKS